MHFADRLFHAIQKTSPICVGIDPRIEAIPAFIKKQALEEFGDTPEAVASAFTDFGVGIIDAVADLVPVIKPQMAFFEMYGSAGLRSFEEICEYAQSKGLIVLADGKRNDIGTTAAAYAEGLLGKPLSIGEKRFQTNWIDATTVTPYLGSDGIKPFQDVCDANDKGIFVLVKTSNESAYEIQDMPVGDELVHEALAHMVAGWGMQSLGNCHYSNVGAVVGGTYGEEIAYLRSLMPNQFFLVPGYGAQGAGAEDVRPCFNADGTGALISSSREINYAYLKSKKFSPEEFDEAAREAVLIMKQDLESITS